ncbi:MAG TPA: hypothetical protein VJO99_12040 [Burkholderiaceae bacterium]|nr:hypothetical protein [Burkholderiaceae bacterium]
MCSTLVRRLACGGVVAALLVGFAAHATPIVPARDDEVIEVLPASSAGVRADERHAREQLAKNPRDAALALAAAKRELARAHELGDPRFAGRALAAIAGWNGGDEASVPAEVLLMRASVQQYLHEFDAAAATLQRLLARVEARSDSSAAWRPQAWLTLATVRRVQGRYADSDVACRQVALAGATLHGVACQAENAALRGEFDRARGALNGLLATPRLPSDTQAWLLTTRAELEQRAGRAQASDAAYRAALQAAPNDSYAVLAYADFLIEQRRPQQALVVLRPAVRSDAVLLRLAIAGLQAGAREAVADAAEMRERIALANERPEAKRFHGREQAMFALWVERDPARALELARGNVAQQREPLDLLVLMQAARQGGQDSARREAQRLVDEVGLRDERIRALL